MFREFLFKPTYYTNDSSGKELVFLATFFFLIYKSFIISFPLINVLQTAAATV